MRIYCSPPICGAQKIARDRRDVRVCSLGVDSRERARYTDEGGLRQIIRGLGWKPAREEANQCRPQGGEHRIECAWRIALCLAHERGEYSPIWPQDRLLQHRW